MEIQAEEDYIPPYINYDNVPQDRDDVEMTFYTKVYVATSEWPMTPNGEIIIVTTVRRRETSGVSAPSL